MKLKLDVEVYMDYVLVCGQRVNRPKYVARSSWLWYWERLV